MKRIKRSERNESLNSDIVSSYIADLDVQNMGRKKTFIFDAFY